MPTNINFTYINWIEIIRLWLLLDSMWCVNTYLINKLIALSKLKNIYIDIYICVYKIYLCVCMYIAILCLTSSMTRGELEDRLFI